MMKQQFTVLLLAIVETACGLICFTASNRETTVTSVNRGTLLCAVSLGLSYSVWFACENCSLVTASGVQQFDYKFAFWKPWKFYFITARCTLVQSAVLRSYIVSPSVTFRYRDHIGWDSSKIISRPNGLCASWPQHGRSGATGTPPNWGGIGVGSPRSTKKPAINISETNTMQNTTKVTMTD